MTDLSPRRIADFIAPFRVEPGRRVRLPKEAGGNAEKTHKSSKKGMNA